MMNLYKTINKEKILFKNKFIDGETKGLFAFLRNNFNAIVLDKKLIKDSIEEKCILAEELGHYYCDALYSPNEKNINVIRRNEYRAKKWAFKVLLPVEVINNSVSRTNLSKYEFADELGVTVDMLEMAYEYYKNNNLLKEAV